MSLQTYRIRKQNSQNLAAGLNKGRTPVSEEMVAMERKLSSVIFCVGVLLGIGRNKPELWEKLI